MLERLTKEATGANEFFLSRKQPLPFFVFSDINCSIQRTRALAGENENLNLPQSVKKKKKKQAHTPLHDLPSSPSS